MRKREREGRMKVRCAKVENRREEDDKGQVDKRRKRRKVLKVDEGKVRWRTE